MSVNAVLRHSILAAAHNPLVSRVVERHGMRLGAARFVAGESLDDAVTVHRTLNDAGLLTNTTLLGEGVSDPASVEEVVRSYADILDRIAEERLHTNVALKLTHLALDISEDLAFRNVERLVEHAQQTGNFIRIDMEESARVDPTLRIYTRLRSAGHENVGTVLQSYLYRSERDLRELLPLAPNLRLVKGAYLEPDFIAMPRKRDVDVAFLRLAKLALSSDGYTAIATHDERIIDFVVEYTTRHGIGRDRFELQMLYGIRQQLQIDLAAQGFQVRVATPYGPAWYPYLMRRMAERPANLLFVGRNLLLGRG